MPIGFLISWTNWDAQFTMFLCPFRPGVHHPTGVQSETRHWKLYNHLASRVTAGVSGTLL